MQFNDKKYKELRIESTQLEIPRNTYQRELNTDRVHKIVKQFDERVANEPKVSYRDGRYYVFDGQHTIAARVERNGGKPLMILCKVYYGLTEKEEARLFAEQTGFSADLGYLPKTNLPAASLRQRRLPVHGLIMDREGQKTVWPVYLPLSRNFARSGLRNIRMRFASCWKLGAVIPTLSGLKPSAPCVNSWTSTTANSTGSAWSADVKSAIRSPFTAKDMRWETAWPAARSIFTRSWISTTAQARG